MGKFRIAGFALIAAASLAACTAARVASPAPNGGPAVALGSHHLVRLANYESRDAIDIVDGTGLAAAPAHSTTFNARDEVAKTTALWRAIIGAGIGKPVTWTDDDTGSHGYAEIMRDVPIPESDRHCREYREEAVIGGERAVELGQACQLRDGSWWKIGG